MQGDDIFVYGLKPAFQPKYWTKEELEQNNPNRKDGLAPEKEKQFKASMRKFLDAMADQLKLLPWVRHTAAIYCERFFAKRSFTHNNRFLVVAAAILLAAKATEGPRRAAEVATCYFKTKNKNNEQELAMFIRSPEKYVPEIVDSIFTAERALLYTLSFQINVDLVIQQVFATLHDLNFTKDGKELSKEEFLKLQQLVFNFVNDCYKTTLPIQYPAAPLALACITLSCQVMKVQLPEKAFHKKKQQELTLYEFYETTPKDVADMIAQQETMYVKVSKQGAGADGEGPKADNTTATPPPVDASTYRAAAGPAPAFPAAPQPAAGNPLPRLGMPPPPIFGARPPPPRFGQASAPPPQQSTRSPQPDGLHGVSSQGQGQDGHLVSQPGRQSTPDVSQNKSAASQSHSQQPQPSAPATTSSQAGVAAGQQQPSLQQDGHAQANGHLPHHPHANGVHHLHSNGHAAKGHTSASEHQQAPNPEPVANGHHQLEAAVPNGPAGSGSSADSAGGSRKRPRPDEEKEEGELDPAASGSLPAALLTASAAAVSDHQGHHSTASGSASRAGSGAVRLPSPATGGAAHSITPSPAGAHESKAVRVA